MKTYCRFMLLASILAFAGCCPTAVTNTRKNDTSRLDSMAQRDSKSAEFVQKVELYYQAIQKKDWPTSYDMRTANFKKLVSKDVYLRQMADSGENLTGYKVLNVCSYSGPNGVVSAAEMIIEFNEGGMVSYGCARWIKRDGNWMCLDSGMSGLLKSLNMPDWITN